ncbi:hypothetical protein F4818DRAFT_3928 [Hypoxylon cercidicola]|nr:hypothetical protein F4818DRAFT_3928 [Hypoxylon cercidicola]
MSNVWVCEPCDRTFGSFEAHQQHLQFNYDHHDTHCHCSSCDYWFVDVTAFSAHMKHSTFHNICPLCKVDFLADKAKFNSHMLQHGKCPFNACGMIFQWNQLDDHLQNVHFHCTKCKKTFLSMDEVRGHRETSTLHF